MGILLQAAVGHGGFVSLQELLIILLVGPFVYLIVRRIKSKKQNHIDLTKKVNHLESRIEKLESSVQNLSVKDSFSIGEDGTIIRNLSS
ncbi:MAG: hypothetical protein LBH19_02155 [Dysgonamonadaceae bacterium]|jgi:hypothetical protein|nr:hypothetical protein [Dysgonamonadaceae bacterium]